ncbi:MAG: hypothetical protein LQ343_006671 [Gyalolechia ehrenbergii]|nr:MAG: hypothetical protein LQ343_006671 [Gyalolechia ehrenbergii]
MADEDDDEYLIPLQDQRVFGAGMRRKGIKFVSPLDDGTDQQSTSKFSSQGAGDRYLAIVLNKNRLQDDSNEKQPGEKFCADVSSDPEPEPAICEICRLPIAIDNHEAREAIRKPHETSLAHQACLEHSHPPSHLYRNRHGFKYLSLYGWDPDARQGLGATGTGIRMPIKAQPKNDTLGLGLPAPSTSSKVIKQPLKKLDAKQTRKGEAQAQKERQRLRNIFYQHEDVEKYLGPHA